MNNNFYTLIVGIIVLLIISSLIGQTLKYTIKKPTAIPVIENLNTRINAWWMMVFFLSAAYMLGNTVSIILFAFISFFSLREFITLMNTPNSDYNALSISFFILLPIQYLLLLMGWYGLFAIFIPVYAFLLLPSISVLSQDVKCFLTRTSSIQWAIMISIYCISYAPALLLLDIPGYTQNGLLLFYLLLVVQISDVLQYVFGKLLGKRKIAPIVSPSKTVEGFVFGGIAATLVGGCMYWITPFTFIQSLGMSFVIVIMGFLGGLTLSAVKRSLGAKDWGTMVKGHGGMLDRMDSVCFAAPIFFHMVRYFFA